MRVFIIKKNSDERKQPMISRLRKRLTYSNIAVTFALVFAMSGGAYAAGKYVITSTKQVKPSVLAQLKGAAGKAGPAGAQGPAGPQGPSGAQGSTGKEGPEGKAGTSVTAAESKSKIGPCKEGGSEFKAGATTTYACNGEKGQAGQTGFTAHLPAGKTETGAWSANPTENQKQLAPISFNIPLENEISGARVHIVTQEEVTNKTAPAECPGTAEEPKATEGNFCLYIGENLLERDKINGIIKPSAFSDGVGRTGAVLEVEGSGTISAMWGTWAVTAE